MISRFRKIWDWQALLGVAGVCLGGVVPSALSCLVLLEGPPSCGSVAWWSQRGESSGDRLIARISSYLDRAVETTYQGVERIECIVG